LSGGVSRGFADLHARSGFSFGFGVATPEELVAAAVRMRIPSLALTDWDGLYSIHRFLAAGGCLSHSRGRGLYRWCHVVLLAQSMEGYRSLCRLITHYRASSENHRCTGMLAFMLLSAPVPNLYRGAVALWVNPPQGSSHRPWTLRACLRSCSLAQAERGSLL
jgi:hypothetical protein